MFSTSYLYADNTVWLLILTGPLIGAFLCLRLNRPRPLAATDNGQPSPMAADLSAPDVVRMGIPAPVLARIHDACGGYIKDGELDMSFELRNRRDCDKMIATMREMKENLARTKTFIQTSEAETRAQLDGQIAAKMSTSRVFAVVNQKTQPVVPPAQREQFIAAKQAELNGYNTANLLIDKYIADLGGAEISVLNLPFYANNDASPLRYGDRPGK